MSAFEGVRPALRLGVAHRELEEELAFHHRSTVEEFMERGRSREQAEAEARRRFGDERRWRREIERVVSRGRGGATRG